VQFNQFQFLIFYKYGSIHGQLGKSHTSIYFSSLIFPLLDHERTSEFPIELFVRGLWEAKELFCVCLAWTDLILTHIVFLSCWQQSLACDSHSKYTTVWYIDKTGICTSETVLEKSNQCLELRYHRSSDPLPFPPISSRGAKSCRGFVYVPISMTEEHTRYRVGPLSSFPSLYYERVYIFFI
jgi:hypothetical protein